MQAVRCCERYYLNKSAKAQQHTFFNAIAKIHP